MQETVFSEQNKNFVFTQKEAAVKAASLLFCANIFFRPAAASAGAEFPCPLFSQNKKTENISVFSSFTESVCRADSVTVLSGLPPAFLRVLCRLR